MGRRRWTVCGGIQLEKRWIVRDADDPMNPRAKLEQKTGG